MELPINHKDLDTIINALSLGGDTRLYFLLKNIRAITAGPASATTPNTIRFTMIMNMFCDTIFTNK